MSQKRATNNPGPRVGPTVVRTSSMSSSSSLSQHGQTVPQQQRQTARRGRPFRGQPAPRSTAIRARPLDAHSSQSSVSTRQSTSQAAAAAAAAPAENGVTEDNHCIICMDDICQPKKLSCGHTFCTGCITEYFRRCQEKCPTCGKVLGVLRGSQPAGRFAKSVIDVSLPGYEQYKTIQITYTIPNGVQTVGFVVTSYISVSVCWVLSHCNTVYGLGLGLTLVKWGVVQASVLMYSYHNSICLIYLNAVCRLTSKRVK